MLQPLEHSLYRVHSNLILIAFLQPDPWLLANELAFLVLHGAVNQRMLLRIAVFEDQTLLHVRIFLLRIVVAFVQQNNVLLKGFVLAVADLKHFLVGHHGLQDHGVRSQDVFVNVQVVVYYLLLLLFRQVLYLLSCEVTEVCLDSILPELFVLNGGLISF